MAGNKVKQVHLIISGRVQGVLFRSNTKNQADKLEITGWVKNLPNGSVEITAQGKRETLDNLISWCKAGPLFAKVEKLKVKWQKPSDFFQTFEIIY